MNPLIEGDGCSAQSLKRHGSRNVCNTHNRLGALQCKTTNRRHRLSSVQKRQTFFYLQAQRFDLCAAQCLRAGKSLSFIESLALAD
jgi:hypothetical protein